MSVSDLAAAETPADELAFLRSSLIDLDAELAAGDLSPADHARLRDEYTARLAAALRGRGAPAPKAAVSWPRRLAVGAGVAAFAVGAGLLVARVSGTRTSGGTPTGGIQSALRGQLDNCLELSNIGSVLEALQCYDAVLDKEPSSVEALTYRGWTLVRTGDARLMVNAEKNLADAVSFDPAFPDARVFRAVLFLRTARPELARDELEVFDSLQPPVAMRQLVDGFQLRQQIDEALAAASLESSVTPGPTSTTGGS